MKLIIKRDIFNRIKLNQLQWQYLIFKSIINNRILPLSYRIKAVPLLHSLKPTTTKFRNICRFTGRSRGVFKDFGMSRIMFRYLADRGFITGIRRSTW